MDLFYKRIIDLKFKLKKNFNLKLFNLIINSIKPKFIYFFDEDVSNLNVYSHNINICVLDNNIFIIYFSHLYYDAYSIFYILNLLDEIYKYLNLNYTNENNIIDDSFLIEKNKLFNDIYSQLKKTELNFDIYKLFLNLLKNNSVSTISNFISNNLIVWKYYCLPDYFNLSESKCIYVKKKYISNNNKISTILLFDYLKKKLKFNKYSIFINARKIYDGKDDLIKNYIYISNTIKDSNQIKNLLQRDSKKKFFDLKHQINSEYILINSYLSFNLPSFIKKHICNSKLLLNNIYIFPTKEKDKYVKVLYRI